MTIVSTDRTRQHAGAAGDHGGTADEQSPKDVHKPGEWPVGEAAEPVIELLDSNVSHCVVCTLRSTC